MSISSCAVTVAWVPTVVSQSHTVAGAVAAAVRTAFSVQAYQCHCR